jgi:predicted neuraminidase
MHQLVSNVEELVLEAEGDIPMPPNTPSAHSSSLVALSARHSGTLGVFWFAGARESAPDVQIAFSFFDRKTEQWTPAKFVVNRHVLAHQIGHGVRRLGNPVAWLDSSDRLHLFVVGTGLGGWAAARVIHLVQEGDRYDLNQLRFTGKGTIPLSWLWNTSHLVRNIPVPLSNNGMALPIHFELGVKYPALAWFSPSGDFMGMRRISARGNLLQPSVVPVSSEHWFSFMRMKGGERKIAKAESLDAGKTWRDLPDLNRANPDAALAALGIAENTFVMAKNPSSSSRHELTISRSHNGRNWTSPIYVEKGKPGEEYSYPSLIWVNGSLWISYTERRKGISWQRYSAPKSREGVPSIADH